MTVEDNVVLHQYLINCRKRPLTAGQRVDDTHKHAPKISHKIIETCQWSPYHY